MPDKRHPGHQSRYGKYGPRSDTGFHGLIVNQSESRILKSHIIKVCNDLAFSD